MSTQLPWWRKRIVWYRVAAIVIAVILLCSALISANGQYGWFSGIPTWHTIYAACGFVKRTVPTDELHLTVLDVGDADCLLLQSGGEHLLIDAGNPYDGEYIVDALRAAGVERLDHIIATHTDADHIGGMAAVIKAIGCERVWMPFAEAPDTWVYDDWRATLKQYNVMPICATFGMTTTVGNARLTIISGVAGDNHRDGNDGSLVCRVTFGKHAFLFMADVSVDVEKELLNSGIELTADVIKIAHHGSGDASDPAFITAVDPTYAIITCDKDTSDGNPHINTLKTLETVGVQVYRTDLHGEITICSDGQTLSVI